MKKLTLFFTMCLIVTRLCASVEQPAVARISSYMQGIVNMKVNLGQHVANGGTFIYRKPFRFGCKYL